MNSTILEQKHLCLTFIYWLIWINNMLKTGLRQTSISFFGSQSVWTVRPKENLNCKSFWRQFVEKRRKKKAQKWFLFLAFLCARSLFQKKSLKMADSIYLLQLYNEFLFSIHFPFRGTRKGLAHLSSGAYKQKEAFC